MEPEQLQDKAALLEGAIHQAWDEYYAQLGKVFTRVRGRGLSPNGHRYYRSFRRIAELCLDGSVPVRDYVATGFGLLMKSKRAILPSDLLAANIMQQYRVLVQQHGGGEASMAWKIQVAALRRLRITAPEEYPTDESILLHIMQPFEPWFRVLYLQPFNEKLFRYYGKGAWDDLYSDPNLRAFVRQRVPENVLELEKRTAYFGDVITR